MSSGYNNQKAYYKNGSSKPSTTSHKRSTNKDVGNTYNKKTTSSSNQQYYDDYNNSYYGEPYDPSYYGQTSNPKKNGRNNEIYYDKGYGYSYTNDQNYATNNNYKKGSKPGTPLPKPSKNQGVYYEEYYDDGSYRKGNTYKKTYNDHSYQKQTKSTYNGNYNGTTYVKKPKGGKKSNNYGGNYENKGNQYPNNIKYQDQKVHTKNKNYKPNQSNRYSNNVPTNKQARGSIANQKKKNKKKKKINRLKVVVRSLPYNLTEEGFLQVEPVKNIFGISDLVEKKLKNGEEKGDKSGGNEKSNVSEEEQTSLVFYVPNAKIPKNHLKQREEAIQIVNWYYYMQGNDYQNVKTPSVAYMNFSSRDEVAKFSKELEAFCQSQKGKIWSEVSVEYAPFQYLTKTEKSKKVDNRMSGTIFEDEDYKKFVENLDKPVEKSISADFQLEIDEKKDQNKEGITPLIQAIINSKKKKYNSSSRYKSKRKRK